MMKGILFLISTIILLAQNCENSKKQKDHIVNNLEIVNNEEFINFYVLTKLSLNQINHKIKITSEYSRYKEIMDVDIKGDTILLLKKQILKYSLPIMNKEKELISDTTYVRENIYLPKNINVFCFDNNQNENELINELCDYLSLLKEENKKVFLAHFKPSD